ncbi:MAG: hypothetical protein WA004_13715 [Saprospiraceae bacterium]
MLRIFQTNQILGAVLFLPYLALFYSANFVADLPAPVVQPGIFSHLLMETTAEWPELYLRLTALLLVFFQAILLVAMVNGNRLNNDSNLLPGVFYCLFASISPEFMYPSPVLLANTFLIFALMELMAVYKLPVAEGRLFNTGLWVGVASLFYFSAIGLLFFLFWGVSSLRAYNIKELIVIVLGAFTPLFLTGTVFFLTGRLPEFWEVQFANNLAFLDFQATEEALFFLELGVFALLVLIVLLGSNTYFQKKIMQVQKKITILYGFLLFTGLTVLFQGQAELTHWLMACIPLAVFFSMSFTTMPAQWAEVVHLLMLAAGLGMAYSSWLAEGF